MRVIIAAIGLNDLKVDPCPKSNLTEREKTLGGGSWPPTVSSLQSLDRGKAKKGRRRDKQEGIGNTLPLLFPLCLGLDDQADRVL